VNTSTMAPRENQTRASGRKTTSSATVAFFQRAFATRKVPDQGGDHEGEEVEEAPERAPT